MLLSNKKQSSGNAKNSKKKESKKTPPPAQDDKEAHCSTVTPPNNFLPFSHDVITSEFEEYARDNLKEFPETRNQMLEELRDAMKGTMVLSNKKQSSGNAKNSKKKEKKKNPPSAQDDTDAHCSTVTPPKNFLPFSHDVITPEFEKYARDHLNEFPETRNQIIEELRDIMKGYPDVHIGGSDTLLLLILRSKKFDVRRSAEFLLTGLTYVENYRYMLERKDPEIVRNVIAKHMVGFLPYRDSDGRAVIYARADAWDPSEIPAADTIFAGIMAVQSAGFNPVNQIMGFVVVLDLKDLKFQQLLAMSRWMIFGTITLQRACPCFLKAFHVINVPPFFKLGWKLVKPLLSEKIRKRFIFHKSSELSSLYSYMPRDILPPELGGPIPFDNDHWAKNIDEIEARYYDNLNNNYLISRRKKETVNA